MRSSQHQDTPISQTSQPKALIVGLKMLGIGYAIVAIHPNSKRPVGRAWGAEVWSAERLREAFEQHEDCGIGVRLGPTLAPGGGDLVDLECDSAEGADSLGRLLGGETPITPGWSATRGGHNLFRVDHERLQKLLIAAGATEGKDAKSRGAWHLDALPGLEIRCGGRKEDGTLKQIQSVVPPTPGTNGKPRAWVTPPNQPIADLPEAAYAFLESVAERLAMFEADQPAQADQPEAYHANQWGAVGTAGPDPERNGSHQALTEIEQRAVDYLATVEAGIQGQNGSAPMFRAACAVHVGFDLSEEVSVRLLLKHYSPRCKPAWSEAEVRHKVQDAAKTETRPRGWLLGAGRNGAATSSPPPPPNQGVGGGGGNGQGQEVKALEAEDDPFRLARIHLAKCQHQGTPTLQFHRGTWWQWDAGAYRVVTDSSLHSRLAKTIKAEFDRVAPLVIKAWQDEGAKGAAPKTLKVTRPLVSNTTLALQALTILSDRTEVPCWLTDPRPFDPTEVLPIRNALVHLPGLIPLLAHAGTPPLAELRRAVLPPTPQFFGTYALDFDFELHAKYPAEWIKFLQSVWPTDGDSINTLQEWFGYCLLPDTSHEKILMMIGPKRSGKGTIARVLRALIGPENIAGPTLASLAGPFGLEPLIGKPLAIISDARLSGRPDAAVIVERLLMISGQDCPTVDRKHRESWNGKLPTRFVLISNKLPKMDDASGAFPSRLILLRMIESFYGREDRELSGRLMTELPGILLWAIEGWKRLEQRGAFIQPKSGADLVERMEELGSPVQVFIRERCEIKPGLEVDTKVLFQAWCDWCQSTGKKEPGTAQSFASELYAACSHLTSYHTTRDQKAMRFYQGIDLKSAF
jgi:putative DNA primase/helicase